MRCECTDRRIKNELRNIIIIVVCRSFSNIVYDLFNQLQINEN